MQEQALFDAGHGVGLLARGLFPSGVLVDVDRDELDRAVTETRRLVARGDVPIFDASFSAGGVFVAVDILEPTPDGWVIHECKATTSTKPHHLLDAAVQVHVLQQVGLRVAGVRLLHLDRECRFPDLSSLFASDDITEVIAGELARVPPLIARLRQVLEAEEPEVRPGPHCRTPYDCPFLERCHARLPKHHIGEFYRLHVTKRQRLAAVGIETIHEVPGDFALTETQARQRRAILADELVVDGDLAERLRELDGWPRSYLDFETISVPIPRWEGCWPWQQVPVQFSLHVEHGDGRLEHFEHLAEPGEDPRPALARALIAAVPRSGPVAVYFEAFEKNRLAETAAALPEFSDQLLDIERRIVDLLPMVRGHVYHPRFHGSFSIKSVVPVLCAGPGWGELEIASGEAAMVELQRLLLSPRSRYHERRAALLRYCRTDTAAMVELLHRLQGLALVPPLQVFNR